MSTDSRRSLWWGLVLGIGLCAVVVAALYFAGFRFMRHEGPPSAATAEGQPLCYVSPSDTAYIQFSPGKDEKGQELVPVYPTQPGTPATGQTVKLWMSPSDPSFIRSKPGVDLKGQQLVPFEGALGKPPAPAAGAAAKGERKIKYWVSPMDPGYIRDKPGKAPCGMDLVPVYESAGEEAPGTIKINPATLQSMGVTTTKVEVRPLSRMTLTVGMVTFDERNLNVITTKMDGWVERLYVRATGDPIHRGQNLLSIYSPELVTTQNEYLLALKNLKSLEKSGFPELEQGARRLLAASRQRLKYWDIPDSQIAALEETGAVQKNPHPGLPGERHRYQARGDSGHDGQGRHAGPGGGGPLHHLGGCGHLSVRAALDQGGPDGDHDPGLSPRRDLPGPHRLHLPLHEGSHPHCQGAPALPQPQS